MHAAWIKIDEKLPWIELEGTYDTPKGAKEAAENCLCKARIKIVSMPEKTGQLKAIATTRR